MTEIKVTKEENVKTIDIQNSISTISTKRTRSSVSMEYSDDSLSKSYSSSCSCSCSCSECSSFRSYCSSTNPCPRCRCHCASTKQGKHHQQSISSHSIEQSSKTQDASISVKFKEVQNVQPVPSPCAIETLITPEEAEKLHNRPSLDLSKRKKHPPSANPRQITLQKPEKKRKTRNSQKNSKNSKKEVKLITKKETEEFNRDEKPQAIEKQLVNEDKIENISSSNVPVSSSSALLVSVPLPSTTPVSSSSLTIPPVETPQHHLTSSKSASLLPRYLPTSSSPHSALLTHHPMSSPSPSPPQRITHPHHPLTSPSQTPRPSPKQAQLSSFQNNTFGALKGTNGSSALANPVRSWFGSAFQSTLPANEPESLSEAATLHDYDDLLTSARGGNDKDESQKKDSEHDEERTRYDESQIEDNEEEVEKTWVRPGKYSISNEESAESTSASQERTVPGADLTALEHEKTLTDRERKAPGDGSLLLPISVFSIRSTASIGTGDSRADSSHLSLEMRVRQSKASVRSSMKSLSELAMESRDRSQSMVQHQSISSQLTTTSSFTSPASDTLNHFACHNNCSSPPYVHNASLARITIAESKPRKTPPAYDAEHGSSAKKLRDSVTSSTASSVLTSPASTPSRGTRVLPMKEHEKHSAGRKSHRLTHHSMLNETSATTPLQQSIQNVTPLSTPPPESAENLLFLGNNEVPQTLTAKVDDDSMCRLEAYPNETKASEQLQLTSCVEVPSFSLNNYSSDNHSSDSDASTHDNSNMQAESVLNEQTSSQNDKRANVNNNTNESEVITPLPQASFNTQQTQLVSTESPPSIALTSTPTPTPSSTQQSSHNGSPPNKFNTHIHHSRRRTVASCATGLSASSDNSNAINVHCSGADSVARSRDLSRQSLPSLSLSLSVQQAVSACTPVNHSPHLSLTIATTAEKMAGSPMSNSSMPAFASNRSSSNSIFSDEPLYLHAIQQNTSKQKPKRTEQATPNLNDGVKINNIYADENVREFAEVNDVTAVPVIPSDVSEKSNQLAPLSTPHQTNIFGSPDQEDSYEHSLEMQSQPEQNLKANEEKIASNSNKLPYSPKERSAQSRPSVLFPIPPPPNQLQHAQSVPFSPSCVPSPSAVSPFAAFSPQPRGMQLSASNVPHSESPPIATPTASSFDISSSSVSSSTALHAEHQDCSSFYSGSSIDTNAPSQLRIPFPSMPNTIRSQALTKQEMQPFLATLPRVINKETSSGGHPSKNVIKALLGVNEPYSYEFKRKQVLKKAVKRLNETCQPCLQRGKLMENGEASATAETPTGNINNKNNNLLATPQKSTPKLKDVEATPVFDLRSARSCARIKISQFDESGKISEGTIESASGESASVEVHSPSYQQLQKSEDKEESMEDENEKEKEVKEDEDSSICDSESEEDKLVEEITQLEMSILFDIHLQQRKQKQISKGSSHAPLTLSLSKRTTSPSLSILNPQISCSPSKQRHIRKMIVPPQSFLDKEEQIIKKQRESALKKQLAVMSSRSIVVTAINELLPTSDLSEPSGRFIFPNAQLSFVRSMDIMQPSATAARDQASLDDVLLTSDQFVPSPILYAARANLQSAASVSLSFVHIAPRLSAQTRTNSSSLNNSRGAAMLAQPPPHTPLMVSSIPSLPVSHLKRTPLPRKMRESRQLHVMSTKLSQSTAMQATASSSASPSVSLFRIAHVSVIDSNTALQKKIPLVSGENPLFFQNSKSSSVMPYASLHSSSQQHPLSLSSHHFMMSISPSVTPSQQYFGNDSPIPESSSPIPFFLPVLSIDHPQKSGNLTAVLTSLDNAVQEGNIVLNPDSLAELEALIEMETKKHKENEMLKSEVFERSVG
ncbi:uncharacterized protein MONOS_11315 [Monocercomonoides exilis]|uniref:uncharacterized protein n=1 Tax=Monocercomonoides exilis TaxID=2049356 RepID=UPI003559CBA1|nr:hypothetical protein MONOS_11315 [Monocercomonoides exilis]|eukprot:MONOS_11315.1-p1 / transcript=MONOS_11315.1 / gene=MONOS_11315 / organism=Monocercomonoides_exilis_PA203 / gene_product=unspecified product / transcript_product=unspecified product / location=Mono_scaffold00562:10060-15579(-) / protein_length=1840 / sequence_SO=supercontig / SO=protein_coding / is_pseudo=false